MTRDEFLELEPFSILQDEKESFYREQMNEMTDHHRTACKAYDDICNGLNENGPYLPVSLSAAYATPTRAVGTGRGAQTGIPAGFPNGYSFSRPSFSCCYCLSCLSSFLKHPSSTTALHSGCRESEHPHRRIWPSTCSRFPTHSESGSVP